MAKISTDLRAGTLHPRENLFVAGNLGSLNAEVIVPCDGCSLISLDIRGTFNLTIEVSGTADGSNWVPIPIRALNVAAKAFAATATTAGVFLGAPGPYREVRARVTAYTSGTAIVTISASNAATTPALEEAVTPLLVTATGASGAAVTLTLPSPGAGLRQYITYLSINRFAAAALTAAATPVVVTTTNLPGSLALSFAADALTLGQMDRWREDFAFPLAASAQGTAATIVCPATPNVIWRATAGYYLAP